LANENDITALRKRIDAIDEQIMKLLSERVELSQKIGKIKKKLNKPILDTKREREIYDQIKKSANKMAISPDDCIIVFNKIIRMCKNAQNPS